MEHFSCKKILKFIAVALVLYFVAGILSFNFGKGLFVVTSINLYPHAALLHKIFFVLLCIIALFRAPIAAAFLGLAHRDVTGSGGAGSSAAWKRWALFLAAVIFFHLRITSAFLGFANWYARRKSTFMVPVFDSLRPSGVLQVLVVSILLSVLSLRLLRRSRRVQAAAPILALVCAVLAALALLGLGGEGLTQEFVISQFSPVSLPDKDVLMWALPALVLAYFGNESTVFQTPNRLAKLISYGAIALSCTIVGDLLSLVGGIFR